MNAHDNHRSNVRWALDAYEVAVLKHERAKVEMQAAEHRLWKEINEVIDSTPKEVPSGSTETTV